MYNLDTIHTALQGTIFADHLHYQAMTESTNSDAVTAARQNAPHGSVYFANAQSAGRGRGGHAWSSPAGDGLYVSVLTRPHVSSALLPLLPLAAGLAAIQTIQASTELHADLRWPNDILIGPRKVGGILVESHTVATAVDYAVIGIGINVHQRDFAPDLATPATSLDMECKRSISRQEVLITLLKFLEKEVQGLSESTAVQEIPQRIEAASTWICGRKVEVHGPQACTGITAGLNEQGFLLVRSGDRIHTIQTGGLRADTQDENNASGN